jgi:lipoate-protein ligase A
VTDRSDPLAWTVEHRSGDAGELHLDDVPARRLVRVHAVRSPALVLGSTQPDDLLDAAVASAAGFAIARRRSGGGVVHLAPGDQVWVDVVVPAGDPLWDDDVCRASWWLGDAWASSIGGVDVHRGAVTDRAAGRNACFAALGPGEVFRSDGTDRIKLVGVSQRRTRLAARFQCVAYRRWDPEPLLAALDPAAADAVGSQLRRAAAAVLTEGWDPVEDLVPHLPS